MSALLFLLCTAFAAPTEDAPPAEPAAPAEAAADTGEATDGEAGDGEVVEGEEAEPEVEEEPPWEPTWPGEPAPDSKHYDLEQMYASKQYKEGWKAAKQRLSENPDDADLHWMVARYMYEVGELMDKKTDDKEAHYEEMVRVSELGLTKRPGDLHLTFARGIGNGRLGTTRGVLSSLWLASTVEADWLAVANSDFRYASIDGNEILPCDAQYALGIFYRLVPDAWIVKVLSGTRGSLDKSLAYLEKANACSPGRPHMSKELGVTQMCIGTKRKEPAMIEKGKASLQKVVNMSPRTKKEEIDQKHAAMLIENPDLACGYSRDGQQEIDEAKLEQ